MYQVFEINDCFSEYAISYFLIGAKDKADLYDCLKRHHKKLNLSKEQVNEIIMSEEWRIKEVSHLFTDVPYEKIESYGYVE